MELPMGKMSSLGSTNSIARTLSHLSDPSILNIWRLAAPMLHLKSPSDLLLHTPMISGFISYEVGHCQSHPCCLRWIRNSYRWSSLLPLHSSTATNSAASSSSTSTASTSGASGLSASTCPLFLAAISAIILWTVSQTHESLHYPSAVLPYWPAHRYLLVFFADAVLLPSIIIAIPPLFVGLALPPFPSHHRRPFCYFLLRAMDFKRVKRLHSLIFSTPAYLALPTFQPS